MDKRWISEELLIGQSGKTINFRLFVSIGASGAMYFASGFLGAFIGIVGHATEQTDSRSS